MLPQMFEGPQKNGLERAIIEIVITKMQRPKN